MITPVLGFRSFPSGHSSSSFAGLFYLSLYLSGKLHVLDQRGEVWRTLIVLIPTLAASCIAMSRIMDARHHPVDVLFGSALGILVAWGSYRQYFPPVSHSWLKGRAYPIRTWGKEMKKPPTGEDQTDIAMEPLRQRHGFPHHDDHDDDHDAEIGAATAIPGPQHLQQPRQQGTEGNIFRDPNLSFTRAAATTI